jgi:hypothetical protein
MRILVVLEEGMIADIREAAEPEVEVEVEEPEVEAGKPMEEEMAAEAPVKKTVESIIKETFFSKMEELAAENEALKTELAALKAASPEEAKKEEAPVELAAADAEPKPILHNPENAKEVNLINLSGKRGRSTMDSILEKLSK